MKSALVENLRREISLRNKRCLKLRLLSFNVIREIHAGQTYVLCQSCIENGFDDIT